MPGAVAVRAEHILAGPIVRRVSRDRVSVWVAHDTDDANARPVVALKIFRHPQGDQDPIVVAHFDSIRIGDRLWVALPTADLGASPLEAGKTYAYDVEFDGKGLDELHLLEDGKINGHVHLALGYAPGLLPTFRVPADNVDELVIAHGSCRKTGGGGPDTLAALDQIIEQHRENGPRPHYLFFSGDQVYVDDPTPELLEWMNDLGTKLIGVKDKVPIEHLRVELPLDQWSRVASFPADKYHFPVGRRQRLVKRAGGLSSDDNWQHALSLGEIAAEYLMTWCNVAWGDHHLDSDAEWQALHTARHALVDDYLQEWRKTFTKLRTQYEARRSADTNATLPSQVQDRLPFVDAWRLLPPASRAIEWARKDDPHEWNAGEKNWDTFWTSAVNRPAPAVSFVIAPTSGVTKDVFKGAPEDLEALAALVTPAWYAGGKHFGVTLDYKVDDDKVSSQGPDPYPPLDHKKLELEFDHFIYDIRRLRQFYMALPYVRRALANVSTLMMFDDHEVTDDWASDRAWVERVQGRALGRDFLVNALVAYTLFQDWGNDPARYTADTPNKKILDLAQRLYFDGHQLRPSGPDEAARNELDALFNSETAANDRPVWRFSITNPDLAPYEIVLLDSRTRRGFDTSSRPPSPISLEQINTQIPQTGPAQSKVTIVISPLPIFGYPPLEQIKPIAVFYEDLWNDPSRLTRDELAALKSFPDVEIDYMSAKMANDPDPWAFYPAAVEGVLARLSTRTAVVVLSGDIHFAMSAKVTYWKASAGALEPTTRIAQLTSSALRNDPGFERRKYLHLGFAEQFGAIATGPFDRLGWASAGVHGPKIETGSFWLRRLLQTEPVLIPTRMLPEDELAKVRARTFEPAPEWAWRMDHVKDERTDAVRYDHLTEANTGWRLIEPAELTGAPATGIREIAKHHQWHVRYGHPRRVIMTTNLGIVRFERDADRLAVVHSLYGWDASELGPAGAARPPGTWTPSARLSADAYTQHRVVLDPTDEPAPDRDPT